MYKKVEYSKEQMRAITLEGNVIVSAGAGSGKTAVMIERIINKLKQGASIENMLIVTYTRAAASDMRYKLAERLAALKREPSCEKTAVRAQSALDVCDIGTLHGFCKKLIENYYYAADIDPAAVIKDETETSELKLAAIREAVDGAWQSGNAQFCAVHEMLSSKRDDTGVIDAVERIMENALVCPDPDNYLTVKDVKRAEFLSYVASVKADACDSLAELRADPFVLASPKILAAVDALDCYFNDDVKLPRIILKKSSADELRIAEMFAAAKSRVEAFKKLCIVSEADDEYAAACVKELFAVTKTAMALYSEKKKSRAVLDYSDLEHGAMRVLSDAECAAQIKNKYGYVFIDEYQDVNPLQAAIADELKKSCEMFLVGDVKQSIYGFRQCNPKYFIQALHDPDYTHVALNANYRSAPQIIDFVNNVFTPIMTEKFGGADYSQNRMTAQKSDSGSATLVVGFNDDNSSNKDKRNDRAAPDKNNNADRPAQDVEAVLNDSSASAVGGNAAVDNNEVYSVKNAALSKCHDAQALFVADAVQEWIEGGGSAAETAVLVRSVKTEFCTELKEIFEERGIGYGFAGKTMLSDYPEAVALADILAFCDNAFDDVSMFTAMRSPMGGFSDEEIMQMAKDGETAAKAAGVLPLHGRVRKDYFFWQKIGAYNGALKPRLDEFFALRDEISRYAKTHDACDALGYITASIDYFQYVYENGGSGAAVDALINSGADKTVHAFIKQCEQGFELKPESVGDAVTLTTIHSSKGLEFDFVIVADCTHGFVSDDYTSRIIVNDDGVAIKIPDSHTGKLLPSSDWSLANAFGANRMRAEELRLLYVALTRARKKLLVTGKTKTVKPAADALCHLDFLCGAVPRISPEDYFAQQREAESAAKEFAANEAAACNDGISREIYTAVKKRCDFTYSVNNVPFKTCVTALSALADGDESFTVLTAEEPLQYEDEFKPESAKAVRGETNKLARHHNSLGEMSAESIMRRGTAYHRAMELIDFAKPDYDGLAARCSDLQLVARADIITASSKIYELAKHSQHVFRERYFVVDCAAGDESVLVQGVIDLLLVNANGEATIIDYKTSKIERLNSEEYAAQLALYKLAVEKTTPYTVVKCALYSFVTGDFADLTAQAFAAQKDGVINTLLLNKIALEEQR